MKSCDADCAVNSEGGSMHSVACQRRLATAAPSSLRGVIAFLRSCIRSGEKLSTEDEAMVDGMLKEDAETRAGSAEARWYARGVEEAACELEAAAHEALSPATSFYVLHLSRRIRSLIGRNSASPEASHE